MGQITRQDCIDLKTIGKRAWRDYRIPAIRKVERYVDYPNGFTTQWVDRPYNKLGAHDFSKLCIVLKDAILKQYGIQAGYVIQTWDDEDWDWVCDCSQYERTGECEHTPDIYATHWHILEKWNVLGFEFHKPTNEFLYVRYGWSHIRKQSARYIEFSQMCNESDTINGKKKARPVDEETWRALKRLVKNHADLIRTERAQPKLELKVE